MKIDSRYVGREIVMCMCITHEGAERLANLSRAGKIFPKSTAIEILLMAENAFIRVEGDGITSWVAAIEQYRKKEHLREINAEDIQASLLRLFAWDLIGVTMVVL